MRQMNPEKCDRASKSGGWLKGHSDDGLPTQLT